MVHGTRSINARKPAGWPYTRVVSAAKWRDVGTLDSAANSQDQTETLLPLASTPRVSRQQTHRHSIVRERVHAATVSPYVATEYKPTGRKS